MNIYLIFILLILISSYFLELIIELLNIRNISEEIPDEFKDIYKQEKYQQSQRYLKENTYFGLFKETFTLVLLLIVIYFGVLNYLDIFARSFNFGEILSGLIFIFGILFINQIISMPFSIYHTFYLEQKYGFNKTTVKTFILDLVKTDIITLIIGSILISAIILFFQKFGTFAWLWAWLFVSVFQIILTIIAPVFIMPLFNKFIPLEEGELKQSIEKYAKEQKFALKGVYKMDGSKRSTKSNAFFTGLGRYRRIVLFDTLLKKHTTEELVSILAHETGHFKKKHNLKLAIISIITNGLMFFTLSLFINNPGLFIAFKMEEVSIYASLLFFSFLYLPINMIFSVFSNIISRRYEYEADSYAIKTYKDPQAFLSALKKLSVDNLSNLTPHPLKVLLYYSHPPVLKRLEAIRNSIA